MQVRAGAAVGVRQDRDRRVRARPGDARHRDRLDRRHRPRAARGRAPGPLDRGPHRLPRDHGRAGQDAAPEALRAGCWRCATTPSTCTRPSEHDVEFVDLVCVNLYPFERTAARRGVDRARGDREHRHRRPDDDPRGGQELPVRRAGRVSPESYDADPAPSCASPTAGCRRHPRDRSPPRRSPTPRATTPRSRAGSRRSGEDFPPLMVRAFEKVLELPLRREPPPARRLLRAGRRAHARALDGLPARRQGAVVQQPPGPRRRPAAHQRVPDPRLRDHQAQQPVRRRRRQDRARGLPAGVRMRSDVGLRRRDLPEPPRRPRARRGDLEPVRRGAVRPRLRRGRARGARRPSRTCASSTTASAATPT